MGLIRLEPAALKQAARDLDLAQARLDSVDRLIREIAPAIEYNWQSELTPEYLEYLEAVRQKACRIQPGAGSRSALAAEHSRTRRTRGAGSAAGHQHTSIKIKL